MAAPPSEAATRVCNRKSFTDLFSRSFTPLDSRHILIRFDLEEDYMRFPIPMFNKAFLFSITNFFGKPMKIDEPTVDLLKELPGRIWIGTGVGKGFWHSVFYEDLPPYRSHCKKIGHDSSNCKELILVRSAGKDGVDPIVTGKEHKQHMPQSFLGGIKGLLGHLRRKNSWFQQLCFHSLHFPQKLRLLLAQIQLKF
ncbi:hypothetical protein M9H77_08329 [Catharanthus roseus]|uniref:Uncharacterized protein n=1 Tax=Catharanthus roseus TaxID=4058 RepID=A0ACC0BXM9_CATRO|nr:hypothetical protein M9H77_08329 [Catharanthus roseus]